MHTQSRKLILASGITLAMVMFNGTAAAKSMSQDINNARQEVQIWTTYALSPHLRSNDIKVSVENGKATLTGTVEEDVNKDLAKQIALGVSGIKEVDNQIVVQADYVAPAQSSGRSYGEMVDDATITAAVKSKLLWSKHAEGMATEVETKSGKVTLQGTVDSDEAKNIANSLAMNTRGVVSVDNKLKVDSSMRKAVNDDKSTTGDTGQAIADTWITTKVKSTFMYSNNVHSSDISVSTRNGIVTLTGKVDSAVEKALAIKLAQNVRGVKSVDSSNLII
jgi:osmotically-inducible protein OsmY